ncbi:YlbF family regulator [Alkaliphilus serpentinus]|uniref:YlbF family regulator n=1 Tax=Alkaliphilus serpentinus TaxID=1482731 RepID=A0A833M6S9_9FIRM|nr:YlbF family regulator [Alkaliphilus serpentinus]KAB3524859.1 YlbF family regulator [Alkaliphilus serpentinus]
MSIGRQVVQQIINTREFMELKDAQRNLNNYPKIKQEVEVFQKKQNEIMSKSSSPQEAEQKLRSLTNEFRNLSQYPEVQKMIKAGERFNKMMQNIYKEINEGLASYLKG